MTFDLIIWDCDGVLVDSEVIACEVTVRILHEMGCAIPLQEFMDRFIGRNNALDELEKDYGVPLCDRFPLDRYYQGVREAFEAELKPIAHMRETLDVLAPISMCIASGSEVHRIVHSLSVVGLGGLFDGAIFSAAPEEQKPDAEFIRSKPHPDVFLHAARKMGADPSRCLVIEDSAHGITAAKAAGMKVFAFMGASHITPDWLARIAALTPDVIFTDMRQLPDLMHAFDARKVGA